MPKVLKKKVYSRGTGLTGQTFVTGSLDLYEHVNLFPVLLGFLCMTSEAHFSGSQPPLLVRSH